MKIRQIGTLHNILGLFLKNIKEFLSLSLLPQSIQMNLMIQISQNQKNEFSSPLSRCLKVTQKVNKFKILFVII